MEVLRFAAVDMGSNAMRIFFANVVEEEKLDKAVFLKSSLMRVPIRLGEDVFQYGEITKEKVEKIVDTMHAFRHMLKVHNAAGYRVCATSAMREAINSKAVVELVKQETGIEINIITGDEEAQILDSLRESEALQGGKNYLTVDVGGGSTEITLFSNKKKILSHSFNIGTIRMMSNQVDKDEFKFMKVWLKNLREKYPEIQIVGSGGNINKLFRIAEKKEGSPLKLKKLKNLYEYISSFNMEDRIRILELNPDRADVITLAAKLFIKIMKWTKANEIYVPVMGLSDGIVRLEYKKYKERKSKNSE